MDIQKTDLLSLLPDELEGFITSLGEPKYRAKQLFSQMHKGISPDAMTNIGRSTKQKLSEHAYYRLPKIRRKLVSAIDGTVKYLFELYDGNAVESVIMKYRHGNTICVSSQVGCRMGCAFCASTIGGKVRDLAPSEILGQVLVAQNDTGERISNIVMMGIGEPLDNYDNVIRFLHLVGCKDGMNIGYRHKLSHEDMPITLSISLHASDDETRSSVMPINRKWHISALLESCKKYYALTGRRISFEYTLISGKNDSVSAAEKLAKLLNGTLRPSRNDSFPIHVNLIPVNPVTETGFSASGKQSVAKFAKTLEDNGIRATVRRTLGADINASCGQLRREDEKSR